MAWPLQPSGPTVGLVMMMGIFPHPPTSLLPPPTSLPPPSASSLLSWVRASWLGMGDELERGASVLSQLELSLLLWRREPTSPWLFHLFLVLHWFLPYCKTIGKYHPMAKQHDFVLARFCLAAILDL